jgi:CHAT domain-containing protein
LLELIQAKLPNAELAFLSACHSAEGGHITPDERIHLAAALQFCGFRSVVGTLWAMDDKDGPMISKEFYKHMFRNPGNKADFRDSAEALNVAIRAMRKNGVPLERWILFVHIGA